MSTLAFIAGIMSPLRFLFVLAVIGGFIALIVWLVVRATVRTPVTSPGDSDLDRRRRAAEVERLELENEERRRRLGHTPPPIPPGR